MSCYCTVFDITKRKQVHKYLGGRRNASKLLYFLYLSPQRVALDLFPTPCLYSVHRATYTIFHEGGVDTTFRKGRGGEGGMTQN